jgi:Putative GTPase activating protein for Arf
MAPCATETLMTTTKVTNHPEKNVESSSSPPSSPPPPTLSSLEEQASHEIEVLLHFSQHKQHAGTTNSPHHHHHHPRHFRGRFNGTTNHCCFPPHCLRLVRQLPGNSRCMDCHEHNPQWAAVRYGALLCLQCSGVHRSLGVQISSVRSIGMDEWSAKEVLSMLEGGNRQLQLFFQRHYLTEDSLRFNTSQPSPQQPSSPDHHHDEKQHPPPGAGAGAGGLSRDNVQRLRYKTKAALFYRRQMEQHVQTIVSTGPYRGRERSRLVPTPPNDNE